MLNETDSTLENTCVSYFHVDCAVNFLQGNKYKQVFVWPWSQEDFFFKPHLRTFSLILERGKGRDGGREGEGERDRDRQTGTDIDMRNWDWLPPVWTWLGIVYTLTRHQIHNPGLCPDQESNCYLSVYLTVTPSNWDTPARVEGFL